MKAGYESMIDERDEREREREKAEENKNWRN